MTYQWKAEGSQIIISEKMYVLLNPGPGIEEV